MLSRSLLIKILFFSPKNTCILLSVGTDFSNVLWLTRHTLNCSFNAGKTTFITRAVSNLVKNQAVLEKDELRNICCKILRLFNLRR